MELRQSKKTLNFQSQTPVEAYGIYLSPSEKKKIENKIEDLRDLCPAQAGIVLNYQQHEDVFTGSLWVKSPKKRFEARKIGDHPIAILDELILSIKDQLDSWKKSRVFRF